MSPSIPTIAFKKRLESVFLFFARKIQTIIIQKNVFLFLYFIINYTVLKIYRFFLKKLLL